MAIKMCLTREPRAAAAIIREAQVIAKLSHPNVITVHETGRHDEDVFFVMEYVRGREGAQGGRPTTGRDLIRKRPGWRKAISIYRGAGSGLAAAHDAKIIHGDFKPGNILIDERDWPRVADFGLAQVMIDHAPEGERDGLRYRLGTVPYMAPEVLRGQPGDPLSDQWSFCVSLWETLQGGRPFEGATPGELLESIERGDPWALRPEAEVPAAVRAVVRVGLAVEPGERYPDMHALVHELDELGKLPPDEPPPKRKSRGIFLASMLLVGGATLGSLATALVLRPDGGGEKVAEGTAEPAPSLPPEPAAEIEVDPIVREILEQIHEGELDAVDTEQEGHPAFFAIQDIVGHDRLARPPRATAAQVNRLRRRWSVGLRNAVASVAHAGERPVAGHPAPWDHSRVLAVHLVADAAPPR